MALTGKAFLAIWHDVDPPARNEYMEWHTREHMPERLSVPGFTVGKRLFNAQAARYRYGTVYGGDTVAVFQSPAYLERLNNPTAWSNRVQPAFRHFLRVACDRIASSGVGDGGAVVTIRLNLAPGAPAAGLLAGAQALADRLLAVNAACCVHVGFARPAVSNIRTRETDLRPDAAEPGFEAVVLVEGSELAALQAAVPALEAAIADDGCGLVNPATIAYHLAYQLTAREMADARSAP